MIRKNYIILFIAVVVGVLIKLLFPPIGGLTEAGVGMLAVFIPTIILWIGIGTGWTSFLAMSALALTGVMPGQTVFNTLWGNSVNVVIIPMLIIVEVMLDSGAMQYIAEWIISRKIVQGRPYVFFLLLCLAIVLIGTVVYPVVMCFIFLKLIDSVATSIGYTHDDKFYKASLLLTLWISTVTDGIWPFARPIPTVIMAFMSALGYEINLFGWLSVSIPFGIVCVFAAILVIRFFYRPDCSKFINFNDAAIRKRLKENPINRAGKIATLSMIAVIVCWILPYMSFLGGISEFFGAIGVPTAACIAVALLCLITIDGKPIIELGDALSKVNWSLVVFLGAVMFFAAYLGNEAFGIVEAFKSLLAPIAASVPALVVIAIGVFVSCFATNFMSNTVSATVSTSVFIPVLLSYSTVSVEMVMVTAIAIGCVANCAYLTYASSPTSGVILTDETVSIKESFRYSSSMIILVYAMVVVLVIPLVSKVF